MHFTLTGLPPTYAQVQTFVEQFRVDAEATIQDRANRLINSPSFGEHLGRMWLDVARYADTDSAYRPDTKSPYYFPFAFTYRDYVVDSLNADKPFDEFVREQLAADLMGYTQDDPEIAALGFLGIAPHANRSQAEALDDWIDVTSRGLMGVSVACARCHDHKFEPVPTADYYSLRGVFASMQRFGSLDEKRHPQSGQLPCRPKHRWRTTNPSGRRSRQKWRRSRERRLGTTIARFPNESETPNSPSC